MKVILLKDVSGLGRKFDVKEVASGHGLNLLIPRGEAIAATPAALKRVELEKAKIEGERKVREDLLAKNIKDLDGVTITVTGKANAKGHLFAGLHRENLTAELFRQTKLQVDPTFIQVEQPIKEVGEHQITVKAHDKTAKFKLVIEAA
ncbi:MAG TPA: 50S ribosomal protein L9 [Candidatus Paceibacterota bacterium]